MFHTENIFVVNLWRAAFSANMLVLGIIEHHNKITNPFKMNMDLWYTATIVLVC